MVNGLALVTSADCSSVGSISQRDPVGEFWSETGRNALGSTSALIAALTGDWSDIRCGLKPAPMLSMPMMICVALGGGGGLLSVVSVLCGAGGGLTVQPATSINTASTAPGVAKRRAVGTPIRVSTGLSIEASCLLRRSVARPVAGSPNVSS